MLIRTVCAIAIGAMLAGCGGSGTSDERAAREAATERPADAAEAARAGTDSTAGAATESPVWTLESMEIDGEPQSLASGASITLSLTEPSGVAGSAGVNRYSGDFTRGEEGRIVWSDAIARTKMAGPPELMAQEDAFLDALRRTDDMILEKDALVLESHDGSVRLVFH